MGFNFAYLTIHLDWYHEVLLLEFFYKRPDLNEYLYGGEGRKGGWGKVFVKKAILKNATIILSVQSLTIFTLTYSESAHLMVTK